MKVIVTATVLSALWLAAPARSAAQDPAPEPAPPPPPVVRDVAVPRERPSMRDTERRESPPAREAREPARFPEAAPSRDTSGESGGSRRDYSAAEERSRQRPAPSAETAVAAEAEDQQRGERRGAVRRPPSGGRTADGGGSRDSGDRAVPRISAPRQTQRLFVYPDYYRNYNRYYDPWGYGGFGLGYFYYSPWAWDPSYYGSGGYGGYGSGCGGYGEYGEYGGGGGYGGRRYERSGYDVGAVKLKVKPRDAEVYVDGYFAGHVDDFDGLMQSLKLDSGKHRIEVRKPGFDNLQFDVRVQPERSVTFRGEMKSTP